MVWIVSRLGGSVRSSPAGMVPTTRQRPSGRGKHATRPSSPNQVEMRSSRTSQAIFTSAKNSFSSYVSPSNDTPMPLRTTLWAPSQPTSQAARQVLSPAGPFSFAVTPVPSWRKERSSVLRSTSAPRCAQSSPSTSSVWACAMDKT
jgi:hypothetical protein